MDSIKVRKFISLSQSSKHNVDNTFSLRNQITFLTHLEIDKPHFSPICTPVHITNKHTHTYVYYWHTKYIFTCARARAHTHNYTCVSVCVCNINFKLPFQRSCFNSEGLWKIVLWGTSHISFIMVGNLWFYSSFLLWFTVIPCKGLCVWYC